MLSYSEASHERQLNAPNHESQSVRVASASVALPRQADAANLG
jgi:hypothetical protein